MEACHLQREGDSVNASRIVAYRSPWLISVKLLVLDTRNTLAFECMALDGPSIYACLEFGAQLPLPLGGFCLSRV